MDEYEKIKKDEVNEPGIRYERLEALKRITFFNSFKEAEQDSRRIMANHSPAERLIYLEELRKRVYFKNLDAQKRWKPLRLVITIEYAVYL